MTIHALGFISRLRDALTRERAQRLVAEARTEDPIERELVGGHMSDWKADAYSASGDGTVSPGLPEATPDRLYEEFEGDSKRPRDPAP